MKKTFELKEIVTEKKVISKKTTYRKFPFFVGCEADSPQQDSRLQLMQDMLNQFDIIARWASCNYKNQSRDNQQKPVERFWSVDNNLVNLCYNFIAKTLLNTPEYYNHRAKTLPKELNKGINQKLKEVTHGIACEQVQELFKNDKPFYLNNA